MTAATLKWHHELNWRPWSYTDFTDPTALIVNGIRGQLRRSNARTDLGLVYDRANSGGHLDWFADSDEWLHGSADEEVWEISSKMFNWRVGESLPEPLPGEIEIARIVISEWMHVDIESGERRKIEALQNVFSIRARWRSGRYRYRVVDDFDSEFSITPQSSRKTLTLAQLIDVLQSGRAANPDFQCGATGLVEYWWEVELERGLWKVEGFNEDFKECTKGAKIESELYPMLPVWYERRAEEWVVENQAREDV